MTSFGDHLRQAREAKNITIQEIAASTKISSRALQALEKEQFDQLPGGIFNKGFVRSYARYVGLDEEKTVAAYMEAAKATEPEPDLEAMQAQVAANAAKDLSMWNSVTVVGIVALVVALGLGGFWLREQRKEAREQATAERAAASREAQTAVAPVAPMQDAAPSTASTTQAQDATQGNTASNPAMAGTTQSADPVGNANTELEARAGESEPVEVSIQATQRAWISVRSDGKNVESVTLDPDNPDLRSRNYKARERLLLVVGNPAGLTVTYNGKPAGTLGAEGRRATITFTPEGIEKQ